MAQTRPTSITHRRYLTGGDVVVPPPRLIGNRSSRDQYASESKFDANMVIILAALLCALICALGLNSILRCALRCGRRLGVDTPALQMTTATGMKKSRLRRIPVEVYSATDISATECPICLGEFADGEKVRVLPTCRHGFHVRCIDPWLLSHSSCPNCRHSLLTLGDEEIGREQLPPGSGHHPASTSQMFLTLHTAG